MAGSDQHTGMSLVEDEEAAADEYSVALTVELEDGTILPEIVVETPLGHRLRRAEARPVILEKFERHLGAQFEEGRVKELVGVSTGNKLNDLAVDEYVDLYAVKDSKFV